jgi:hypothetical protein
MSKTRTENQPEVSVRRQAVQELLHHPVRAAPRGTVDAVAARSINALESRAPGLVTAARAAGVEVEYLGITDLFTGMRHYANATTDWVLAPVTNANQAVVPARGRYELERLDAAGINFPLIFIADEVPKHRTAHLPAPQPGGYAVLDPKTGTDLIGPIPEPHQSVAMANRLSQASQRVLNGVARTGRAVGLAAATALTAPAMALSALATIDPIILGAIPARYSQPGEPAAWFILTRWDW